MQRVQATEERCAAVSCRWCSMRGTMVICVMELQGRTGPGLALIRCGKGCQFVRCGMVGLSCVPRGALMEAVHRAQLVPRGVTRETFPHCWRARWPRQVPTASMCYQVSYWFTVLVGGCSDALLWCGAACVGIGGGRLQRYTMRLGPQELITWSRIASTVPGTLSGGETGARPRFCCDPAVHV